MDNIRIVLVRTSAPGNIGSVSRAMKTMGLKHLTLVAPRLFPHEEATKMATRGAEDVLQSAKVADSLYGAVHDCDLVVACSARLRSFDLPVLLPERAAEMLYSTANNNNKNNNNRHGNDGSNERDYDDERKKQPQAQPQPPAPAPSVALVFGTERDGLDKSDMQLAHYRVSIPANPENSSLNLASAVQILSYELRKCHINDNTNASSSSSSDDDNNNDPRNDDDGDGDHSDIIIKQFPTIAQMEGFHKTLESILKDTGVANKDDPRQLMQKMRHIFARAELDKTDLNLLRGALAGIQRELNGRK